jgi:hypothetical protein
MYTTPLSTLIKSLSTCPEQSRVDHHLYADDTQLFISFSPHAARAALDSLHVTITGISEWMASNFLSLNPSKTEFLIVGLPAQLSKLHMPSLTLQDNTSITPVNSARNLGIIFDSNLTYDKQISTLTKACYYHIRDLRRIRQTLDFDTARTIATSLVHSKLDYCNSLYYNLPKSQLKRLQAIQNSLARCITRVPRSQHITPVLKSLHWLKVEQRIHYKILSLTYSTLHHNSPVHLRNLLVFPNAQRSTRSSSVVSLFKPSVKLQTGKRSFSFAAPFLWNSLPKDMRTPSMDGESGHLALTRRLFHKRLKTHLFTQSYPP